jgi:homogentisate 1,2-dioxygenase
VLWRSTFSELLNIGLCVVGLCFLRGIVLLFNWNPGQLLHSLYALFQFVNRFHSLVHFNDIMVHATQMSVHILVDELLRKIDPDIENSIFIFVSKGLLQVTLDLGHDRVSTGEIVLIPLTI